MSDIVSTKPPMEHGSLLRTGFGSWHCKWIRLRDQGQELRVRFERGTDDWLEVIVSPTRPSRRAFRRLDHCSVTYRGSVGRADGESRAEVASLVMAIAASIDQRLSADPTRSIAEALGRDSERRTIVFGRDTLLGLLSPDIVMGREVLPGWRLVDVYPTSHLREAEDHELVLVLDFQRDGDGRQMRFEVGRRDESRPAMTRTTNLDVTHLSLGGTTPEGGSELAALVSFVLDLRDHAGLEIKFPDIVSDVARLLPSPQPEEANTNGRVLNLAINAECGQACAFCSVRQILPPTDGGDGLFARVCADLESNRRRGIRSVRINGYDPLAFDRILDVLRHARDLGYEHTDLFSPFTRLANAEFCAQVVNSLPASRCFFVPMYGADATSHDNVVGAPGAFAKLEQALENLSRLCPDAEIRLLCVATRQGLAALPDLARYAQARGHLLSVHMPYPSSESRADRFFDSSPRQADVADIAARAVAAGLVLHVNGIAPCISFKAMTAHGVPIERWLPLDSEARRLPGTEYRDKRFVHRASEAGHSAFHAATVPCPHIATCAISAACPRELLRSYVEAFGSDEFAPVSIAALLRSDVAER